MTLVLQETDSLPELDESRRDLWERQPKEPVQAFAAFCVYRDQSPHGRSLRVAARFIGKNITVLGQWSVTWQWVKRVAAWDAEKDRVARSAQLAEIERINRDDTRTANMMMAGVQAAIPEAAKKLIRQPHALQEWAKTAAKLRRDAMGIAEPKAAQQVTVSGDPENPLQHEVDISAIIGDLPPGVMQDLRRISLAVTLAKAQKTAGRPQVPIDELPILEAEVIEDDDD